MVAIPILFNAIGLWPELTPVANINDDAAHLLFVERADAAIAHGEDPIDFWVPDLDFGFPQFAYYQHLPHLAVVAVYRALLEKVDLVTVFNLVRYVLLVGLPLTVFWSMRRLGFGTVGAAVGAAASSLISSAGGLGFEAGSYLWRGSGVFTQLVAMHVTFVALAFLDGVIARGRGYPAGVIALAALVLSHLLYAYMMVISGTVLVLCGAWRALPIRVGRLALVGIAAAAIASYLLVPIALTGEYLNATPFLQTTEYDSFGAGPILAWLVHGQVLDSGRLPVLTALLAVGITAALVTRARPALLGLALFAVWLILYFGRPTLGGLIDLIPFHEHLFFRRFIGGVHLGAILLMGAGGAWLWELTAAWRQPVRLVTVAAGLALLLAPAAQERAVYYAENATWIAQTRAAIDRDSEVRAILETLATLPPGRVYAGQRTDWGGELDFGIPFRSVELYNLLTFREIPSLTKSYQDFSLNSDVVFDFDATKQSDYVALGVTYVIAPSTRRLPDFLVPVRRTPLYALLSAPASSAAHYARVSDTLRVGSLPDLLPIMRGWLAGPDPARNVLRIDYPARPGGAAGAGSPGCVEGGTVGSERIEQSRITVVAECPTAATLVLTMTYHPNWHVTVDGAAVDAYMVSPSMVGLDVPAGRHTVVAEYRSTPLKAPLLVLGGVVLLAVVVARRTIQRVDAWLVARWRLE